MGYIGGGVPPSQPGGDGWAEIAVPLIQAYPACAIIFMGSSLTLVFGVLNLIVAVVSWRKLFFECALGTLKPLMFCFKRQLVCSEDSWVNPGPQSKSHEGCVCRFVKRFFPTCQVRVVSFYVGASPPPRPSPPPSPPPPPPPPSPPSPPCPPSPSPPSPPPPPSPPRLVFAAAISSALSVRPPRDLNRDQIRPVSATGPQPRTSAPSVRYRTPTAIICAQVFATGPQARSSAPSVRCRTSTAIICAQCLLPDLNQQKECRKDARKNVRQNVRRDVRNNVRRNVRR